MGIFLHGLVMIIGAAAYARSNSVEDLTSYNYHMKVGIPLADRIRRHEERGLKIFGGTVTDISEVPYQVGLLSEFFPFSSVSVCGGSLISSNRVLTAAHCQFDGFFNATSHTVVLGSNTIFSGGLRINTADVVMHYNWNPDTIANDIAVIKIDNVEFTDVIQPIGLPKHDDASENFVGLNAIASGFGVNADYTIIGPNQVLHSVNLDIITNAECVKFHEEFVHDTNICINGADGKSTCFGDSGGPLVIQRGDSKLLVGATSFGSKHGCTLGYPVAFTRITSYLSWILNI